jgi:hypothetical protein
LSRAPDEQERFERGVEEHGHNLEKVADVVGTRTLKQVPNYATNSAAGKPRKEKPRKKKGSSKALLAKQKGAPITSTIPPQWNDDLCIEDIIPLLTEEKYDADDMNLLL